MFLEGMFTGFVDDIEKEGVVDAAIITEFRQRIAAINFQGKIPACSGAQARIVFRGHQDLYERFSNEHMKYFTEEDIELLRKEGFSV